MAWTEPSWFITLHYHSSHWRAVHLSIIWKRYYMSYCVPKLHTVWQTWTYIVNAPARFISIRDLYSGYLLPLMNIYFIVYGLPIHVDFRFTKLLINLQITMVLHQIRSWVRIKIHKAQTGSEDVYLLHGMYDELRCAQRKLHNPPLTKDKTLTSSSRLENHVCYQIGEHCSIAMH